MNNLILTLLNIITIPFLSPLLYGLIGVNLFAVYGLLSFRHSINTSTILVTLFFSLLNDSVFVLNIGTTFLSISMMCLVDFGLKRFFPNERSLFEFIHSLISYMVFFVSIYILGGLGSGDGLQIYSNFSEFLTVFVSSLLMSLITIVISRIKGSFVSGSVNMIKL